MLTKNQKFKVRIESATPEGFGICRVEGRAVFVSSALAGECWEILILKVTKTAVWAKGIELLEESPSRCGQDCLNLCGGCTLRHMTYDEELRVKKDHVDSCLRRIGGQNIVTTCIYPSPDSERYRNKAVFAVAEYEGKAEFGFYYPRSHRLIPISDCLLQSRESLQAARAVTDFMSQNRIPAYDEKTGKGKVRHLFWRESRLGQRLLCIVSARGFGDLTEKLISFLRNECPFLTGIVLNINKVKGNTVLAGDFYTLWGDPWVKETLCGHEFEIAPQAFLQINPPQAERLYEKALKYAGKPGEETLALDLYCGAGTVSLALADRFSHVIAAEIIPEAIQNAKENAKRNRVDNVEFLCGDASDVALQMHRSGLRPDAVIVDPPRKGLAESVVRDISEMNPDRIVYISCNPATLARDLVRFQEYDYALVKAEAFDMFPRSGHIETVCLLTHKD